MRDYNRIIFVGKSGNCREPMAVAIFKEYALDRPSEVLARGLVVLFSEPMNQKAEAILISNGTVLDKFNSAPLAEEELTEDTLVLTMELDQRNKILQMYPNANPENIQVLTEYVGDELEILDPYGGTLQAYGLCYETLKNTIRKLVKKLKEGEAICQE